MTYQEKIEEKKERFLKTAENINKKADAKLKMAHSYLDDVPLGQPYYNNAGGRAFRNKVEKNVNRMESAFKDMEKAAYYEQKAASVGTAGISSDDETAIKQLKAKIDALKTQIAENKRLNAIMRKFKTVENVLKNLETIAPKDGSEIKEQIASMKRCYCKPPSEIRAYNFSTTNNNANLKRLELRLARLEKLQSVETWTKQKDGYKLVGNTEENRLQIVFDDIPSAEIRTELKRNGFKWSPRNKAWQRMLTSLPRYARQFAEELKL